VVENRLASQEGLCSMETVIAQSSVHYDNLTYVCYKWLAVCRVQSWCKIVSTQGKKRLVSNRTVVNPESTYY